jgi:hypothetical protein
VAHRGRKHVAEPVGTGRLDERAREPVERNLGAVESSDRWLEGLDGLRNVCVGRRLGRLERAWRRGACAHGRRAPRVSWGRAMEP